MFLSKLAIISLFYFKVATLVLNLHIAPYHKNS